MLTSCHVVSRSEETVNGGTELRLRQNDRHPVWPRLELAQNGQLRVVEPIVCGHDILVEQQNYVTKETRPNVATSIVGIIFSSLGLTAATIGGWSDTPTRSPYSFVGAAGIVIGAPLALGPLFGHRTTRVLESTTVAGMGVEDIECDKRSPNADRVVIRYAGLRIPATLDMTGVMSSSPFAVVDAFGGARPRGMNVSVELWRSDDTKPWRQFQTIIEAEDLRKAAPFYLAALNVEAGAQPLTRVPRLLAKNLQVTRTRHADSGQLGAVRVSVSVENAGPGDAWGLRGILISNHPELDHRFLYIGHLANGKRTDVQVLIEISPTGENLDDLTLSLRLIDTHRTTSAAEIPYERPVLNSINHPGG